MPSTPGNSPRRKPASAKTPVSGPAPSPPVGGQGIGCMDDATREAMIRLVAYSFYERRGYVGGSELQDWLEAEMEVDRQHATAQPPPGTAARPARAARRTQGRDTAK